MNLNKRLINRKLVLKAGYNTFSIGNLFKKLEKYYELDFEEFLNEVKKKVDIEHRETQELLEDGFN